MKSKILKWIARIIGTIAAAFFAMMVFGGLPFDMEEVTAEGVFVVVFTLILVAGVIIAWIKELLGGKILMLEACAFMIFIYITAGTNRLMAAVLISLPFWISGLLFYMSGKRKLKESEKQD